MEITHTNKLYLPAKWVRVVPVEELEDPNEPCFRINPALIEDEDWLSISKEEQGGIIKMWTSCDSEGAIQLNEGNVDCVKMLFLGFISTIQGL